MGSRMAWPDDRSLDRRLREPEAMDQDLVVRAQKGDQRAFEALALKSHARLQAVAVGILRDPHLAEDAVQQALLDIWRNLRSLRDPLRFEGWSYRLLVRVCYAEAKRQPKWATGTAIPEAFEPKAADAYSAVMHRDQLERAFSRLSVEHRAVVVLHRLQGMPLEKVADVLDIPIGTVKSRLSRAMEGLRAALEADARTSTRQPGGQEAVR
jgi:RNA polymerase sigma-70 factor (ECF subfamily)